MDVTGSFFDKLRTLAVTVEKQTEQLKQIFHGGDTEFEDDSPMRYLHDLYSEVGALKVDADNTLCKSSSERDATYDFIKAIKVLMKRNATELGKISDVFQKYGYKPFVSMNTVRNEAENHPESIMSEQEEAKNLACPEKLSGPHSPLQLPQLSDFGLSKYALPSTLHLQPQAYVQKEEPKVDDSESLSPKTEHFHIHGCDLCLNDNTTNLTEDQTIFLLNAKNIRQTNKLNGPAAVLTSKENLATPKQKSKLCDYDCMASPAAPVFSTPGLKIPSRKNLTLPNSPETNQLDASNPATETFQDMQSLKVEPKQIPVTHRVPNNHPIGSSAASIQGWDKDLECLEEPSPPKISDYTNLLGSPPPPPQITAIPKQILQILSKYNPNFDREPLSGTGNKENREFTG
ncbi:spindle and kinetochore-associated protein 3 [Tiliqua scincoides]|uniref:spindle and kinetochore-associated protein 3 n=1 Tax=Tiliqua scincoides TaxID=71010 RepID=UPI00346288C9